jgi:hypothetical protein
MTGFKLAFSVAIGIGLSAIGSGAAQLPSYWRKSMTNDPATNYYVAQSMKPLASVDAQTLRVVQLAGIAGGQCKGAAVNAKALQAYKAKAGYSKLKGKAYEDAAFLADDSFKYFDYQSLAHLCAGSGYLFGPEGHLAAGLVKTGKGGPKAPYDGENPYLRLPSLMKKPH